MRWILEPFRRCFDYSGRSRRREYWTYALLTFVILAVVGAIEDELTYVYSRREDSPLSGILVLGLMVPGLAVSVRRLHDSDRAGWWLALPMAPVLFWAIALIAGFGSDSLFKPVLVAMILSPLVVLALMCVPGTRGPNRFGPDPKQDHLADIFA
jgi:uncharacterized membrane protein YhaH (DUF805 family)